jgi:hypothetical protein
MRPDYIGKALKYAQTPEEAAKLLGKFDKKLNIIIDKRGSVLSNVSINEETRTD